MMYSVVQAPVLFQKEDGPTEMEVKAAKKAQKDAKKAAKTAVPAPVPKRNVRKRR